MTGGTIVIVIIVVIIASISLFDVVPLSSTCDKTGYTGNLKMTAQTTATQSA